jgi:hypothetical protein
MSVPIVADLLTGTGTVLFIARLIFGRQRFTTGEITNLMAVDANRIMETIPFSPAVFVGKNILQVSKDQKFKPFYKSFLFFCVTM